MQTLIIDEYETATAVALSAAEAAALGSFGDKLLIRPGAEVGTFDLTAGSHIGALTVGSFAIEIRPKVPIDRVLFLIGYAADPDAWLDLRFDYSSDDTLMEALIPGFVAAIRRAISRGLLEGYQHVEEALPLLRGRVRFDDQIRRRYGRMPPAEVRYDEFTADILENRLIRAALLRVSGVRIRSEQVRRSIRSVAAVFAGVHAGIFHAGRVPTVAYTRLNQHYRGAVELARLILQSFSIRHGAGAIRSSAFLVNMNKVFERFVVVALREALHADPRTFPAGAAGRAIWLDDERLLSLEPDLSWWQGSRCVFVGDAKYKKTQGAAGAPHPDVYQALAYAVALGLPRATLIYAAGEHNNGLHRISAVNKEIEVKVLDLTMPPSLLLAQVRGIADDIRRQTEHSVLAA